MTRGRIVDAKTRLDATIKLVRLVVLVCQTKTIKASVKLTAHRISKVVPKIPSGTLLLGPSTINVAAVRSKTGIKRVAMIKNKGGNDSKTFLDFQHTVLYSNSCGCYLFSR